jgi:hypothetical protein
MGKSTITAEELGQTFGQFAEQLERHQDAVVRALFPDPRLRAQREEGKKQLGGLLSDISWYEDALGEAAEVYAEEPPSKATKPAIRPGNGRTAAEKDGNGGTAAKAKAPAKPTPRAAAKRQPTVKRKVAPKAPEGAKASRKRGVKVPS